MGGAHFVGVGRLKPYRKFPSFILWYNAGVSFEPRGSWRLYRESKDNLSFMDRKEISGSVLKQLEMAYDTLLLYNRRISKFNGLERVDHLLYSTDGIREALVNSLIHCDYSQYIFRFEVEFLLVLLFDCFRATEVLLFNSFQGKRFLEHDL